MKFIAEGDGQAKWAERNDSRITRVGRFIRRIRIDEIPRLVNALRGEMRIVGPRPERPCFVRFSKPRVLFFLRKARDSCNRAVNADGVQVTAICRR